MVGQRWANLDPIEKQHYVRVAQAARKASQGVVSETSPLRTGREERRTAHSGNQAMLQLSTDERQLRPKRQARYSPFGQDFIELDQDISNHDTKLSKSRKSVFQKNQNPHSRTSHGIRKRKATESATMYQRGQTKETKPYIKANEDLNDGKRFTEPHDEEDVVGLLADMRAEAVSKE